jgi:signal transduction histidine kinase
MVVELAGEYARIGSTEVTRTVLIIGTPRSLHPWINDEVLRIAHECLRNAFQHSGATSIEVELKFDASHLGIRFFDNGIGIDAEVLRNGSRVGHWGLIGMKERASQMGAKLEVWSKPSAGTELDLSIPGNIAYDRTEKKGGLHALRKKLGKTL